MKATFYRWTLIGLAAAVLVSAPSLASAQIQTFANFGDIKGDSTDKDHKDWVDVLSIRQAYALPPGQNIPGRSTGAQNPNKDFCTLEIVKGLDSAGPKLWMAMMKGTHLPEVTIQVTRPVSDTPTLLYEIKLKEVLVTGMVTTGGPKASLADYVSGGMAFAETVTIEGMQVELTYYKYKPDGSSGGNIMETFKCF